MPLARHEDIDEVGRFLFDNGIYVTLAAYPLVPKSEVGFRIQTTAANTHAEIEQLVDVLGKLASAFDLQPARETSGSMRSGLMRALSRHDCAHARRGSWYLAVSAVLAALYLFFPPLKGNGPLINLLGLSSPSRS